MDTPDLFGGTAVTSKNIYRINKLSTFTEVAGAATFNRDPGDVLEVVFGQGSDDDMDEPFGCRIEYTVPCKETPILSAADYCKIGSRGGIIDDSVEGDPVLTFWDPEDGVVIDSTHTVDIDNGDVMSILTQYQGAYEEAWGNPFTPCDNVLVIHYSTVNYTSWKATRKDGTDFPTGEVPVSLHTTAALYADKAFKIPELVSNEVLEFYLVADASGASKEPDQAAGNVTAYIYDNNWYIDNDVTPSVIKCGAQDEDGNDLGSNGADSQIIYLAP